MRPISITTLTHLPRFAIITWWRHQMETFSALLAICARNSPVSGEYPAQRPVTRSFDVFFDLCLDGRLSKHSWGWWLETQSRPLWRHSNEDNASIRISYSVYRGRVLFIVIQHMKIILIYMNFRSQTSPRQYFQQMDDAFSAIAGETMYFDMWIGGKYMLPWRLRRQMSFKLYHRYTRILHMTLWCTTWPFWQKTFSNEFSWMEMIEFRFKFRWNLFSGVQWTISHHRFR